MKLRRKKRSGKPNFRLREQERLALLRLKDNELRSWLSTRPSKLKKGDSKLPRGRNRLQHAPSST